MSIDASWTLDDAGASAETPAADVLSNGAPKTVSLFTRGPLAPFQRDQKSDFANASGAPLVRSRVHQIVGLASAAPDGTSYGDLEWDQALGTQLHRVRHRRLNPSLQELLRYFVAEAIPRFEPDIRLTSLRVVLDKNQRASRLIGKFQLVDGRRSAVGPEIDIDVPVSGEEDPS